MPRKCTICTHAKRNAIDSALVNGESYRTIATQFEVSTAALQRHKAHHLPATLAQAQNACEATRGEDLLEQVSTLRVRARLLGELQEGTQVNITIAPQWIELRTLILSTLTPYPDARQAIAQALKEGDHER